MFEIKNKTVIITAESVAALIVQALKHRKSELVMTAQGKLTVWLNKFFPRWVDRLVFKHFAKEADSPLK